MSPELLARFNRAGGVRDGSTFDGDELLSILKAAYQEGYDCGVAKGYTNGYDEGYYGAED